MMSSLRPNVEQTKFPAIAENSKLQLSRIECNAIGTLGRVEGKFQITQIELLPIVAIFDHGLKEKALRVLEMGEKACLISNSILSKVVLEPTITVAFLP